jgi:multisite-specific tRNA:(cytosine-C5)-methyltransferase
MGGQQELELTANHRHALVVQQRLIDYYVPEISKARHNGELVNPPTPIPWYPEKLAWSLTTPKNIVRRFAPFAKFQKFLVSETTVGNISRQEVVSMIPPLLIDVRPGMTVLDMCAAPGSKSAQLIEMVHRGEETRTRKIAHDIEQEQNREPSPDGLEVKLEQSEVEKEGEQGDWSDDGRSTGLLIANDNNYQRAQMLIHQVKRLNSPNLIVTNHDASIFPSIKISTENGQVRWLKFDRILADVPCSGDGTARKNPNVWKDWAPSTGMGLHGLQVRILTRALQMLKVGGRAVYSTCSLNPVENEAVIAAAIESVGGLAMVRIVDCKDELPELKRVPGLKDWKLMDRYERFYNSWEDLESAKSNSETENREALDKFTPSMFAPQSKDEADRIPLERCIRVYPHLQDTGGFFITVLEKLSEIKATTTQINNSKNGTTETKRKREEDDEVLEGTTKKAKPGVLKDATAAGTDSNRDVMTSKPKTSQGLEEVYNYLDPKHPVLQEIAEYYQLSPRFPNDRYMVRNVTGEPAKAIYYTSALVRDILTLNEGKGIKFVQAGVKMFMRQDAQGRNVCRWRIQSEGTPILDSWVGEDRVIRLYKKAAMKKLLIEMFMKIDGPGWESMGEVGPKLDQISMGCCLIRVEPSDDEDGFK